MKRHIIAIVALAFCALLYSNSDRLIDRERLVFDIKYGIISAGEASLNLHRTTFREQDVWNILVTAQTNSFFDRVFKVRDQIESMATYDSLYSLRFTKRMHEGSYRQHRIHQNYLHLGYSIYSRFQYKQGTFIDTRMEIPSNTYDLMSAFYYTRTQDLQPGQVLEIPVTVDGKNYIALVHIERRETIDTIFGRKRCLVIRPDLKGEAIFKQTGDIFVWLTDDEHKIPVLLESKVIFGSFRAILAKVEKVAV